MKTGYVLVFLALLAPLALWWAHKPAPAKSGQKVLIVGTNPTFPPFEFIENGKMAGFDIDLMNAIAQEMDATIEWHSLPFDGLIPGLQTGMLPIVAAGMTPTPERAQKTLFSKPYLAGDPLVIVSNSTDSFATLADLAGKTVVVNEGFSADFYLTKYPEITLLRLETPEEAFLALKADRAHAFVAALNSVKPFLEKYGSQQYAVATIPGTNESAALCISKKHPHLLYEIDAALDKLAQKGIIEQLKQKWKLS